MANFLTAVLSRSSGLLGSAPTPIKARLARTRFPAAGRIITGHCEAGLNVGVSDKDGARLRVRTGVCMMAQLANRTFTERSTGMDAPIERTLRAGDLRAPGGGVRQS